MPRFAIVAILICIQSLAANPKAQRSPKDWTLLVFLNADNNLDRFGVQDIQEMVRVGSNENTNVVVQIDRAYGKPAQRIFIKKDSYDVLQELGEVDMGSIDTYVDFVTWGASEYPARKYAVIMWNHGSGWSKKPGTEIRGISYDDQSNNHITTRQLETGHARIHKALGKKLDVLAFDACLMQMVEVAYAVREHVKLMLASEEVEPGEGWAYEEALKALQASPTAEEFATRVVDSFIESYLDGSQGNREATQSYVYPAQINGVVKSLNKLSTALAGQYTDAVKSAIQNVQRYHERSNADLIHFLRLLEQNMEEESVRTLIQDTQQALQRFVGHSHNTGKRMQHSYGTAIYLPTRGWSFSDKYLNLGWADATQWDEFLKAHFQAIHSTTADLD